MNEPVIDRDGILQQLERVISSSVFRRAERSMALLRFIVEQTLQGHADRLKEYTLGAEGLGRGDSFDPGGRRLAYYERSPETGFDLWTAPVVSGDNRPRLGPREPFLRTRAFEVYPSFSPDGRWIAYASNESGTWEIYVRRFPDDGTKVRVSLSGGVVPYWSPNERELIYRTDANQVMVLPYKVVGDSFTAGSPRPWSQHTLADTGVLPNFAVDSTGERILALIAAPEKDPQTANHVTVIVNFDESVRRAASR
jgi:eukaryotic-like serine/threonine-protein kinase